MCKLFGTVHNSQSNKTSRNFSSNSRATGEKSHQSFCRHYLHLPWLTIQQLHSVDYSTCSFFGRAACTRRHCCNFWETWNFNDKIIDNNNVRIISASKFEQKLAFLVLWQSKQNFKYHTTLCTIIRYISWSVYFRYIQPIQDKHSFYSIVCYFSTGFLCSARCVICMCIGLMTLEASLET